MGERIDADVLVVGAGAAGLATAIFAARATPALRVWCIDGAARVGAKILVSGGSRCNVTNRDVRARDFWGGSARVVTRVLQAFPASRAVEFFEELGVALHEEEDGKLFPDSNTSRTVLDALLREAQARDVVIMPGRRVGAIRREGQAFGVEAVARGSRDARAGAGTSERQTIVARAIVLATGGRSLPKTGSDGHGYELARAFGHRCVDTTPALAPLVVAGQAHEALSGVSHPAALALWVNGATAVRLDGALLWTHFGVSGPVVLNLSRHWHRAVLEHGRAAVTVTLSVLPGDTHASLDAWLLEEGRVRPRAQVATVLSSRLPAAVAGASIDAAGLARETTMAHLGREPRRALIRRLLEGPLAVEDSRGYNVAEVTAGGVPLDEIDSATMESRLQEGLYLVGEILDVDGRLGGFNFQWAWSSGWVAGHAVARMLSAAAS